MSNFSSTPASASAARVAASDPASGIPDPDPRRTRRRNIRLGIALGLGAVFWVGPFMANNAVLLPARIEQIAPDQKVGLVALLAITGSIVAMLANILFGALSDITRTRIGRRTPWLIVGSLGATASLVWLMAAGTTATIVTSWCFFQFFLNAVVAPLLAIIPDRVSPAARGTFSAVYGTGALVGAFGGQIVASRWVTDPQQGMLVFAVVMLLAAPAVWLIAPEGSQLGLARPRLSLKAVALSFSFPTRDARDYYLALFGKLLFVLGTYTVTGYQLYILTDYIHVTTAEAGGLIAKIAGIQLLTSLIFGLISGPISDAIKRRKALVVGSAVLVAIATMIPFFFPNAGAVLVYALVAGIGTGIYNSVDQAMNTEVLPSGDNAAKDLGILNMANTGGQILGPAITSGVVSVAAGFGPVFLVGAGIAVASAVVIAPIRRVR